MQSKSKRKLLLSVDGDTLPDRMIKFPHQHLENCLSRAKGFCAKNNRPFIIISYAQSVDGSIASRNRMPIHLSGPESSVLTHQIRAGCDAILIGIGTLLADDPQLTVRLVESRNPQPIILDTHLRTPLNAKLVKRSDLTSWIINEKRNTGSRARALIKAGAEPVCCATAEGGRIDLHALMAILAKKRVNSIMVEGGAKVITSFVNSRLVDQFIITVSPRLVGGLHAVDSGETKFKPDLRLAHISYQRLSDDLIIWARPEWN
jgi:3,4-dihydroxy 2-butanone 4-phosphate synthase/GTP cyclohydrolase II